MKKKKDENKKEKNQKKKNPKQTNRQLFMYGTKIL